MKHWTIGKRITFGFSLVLIIMAALGGYNLWRLSVIDQRISNVATNSLPGLQIIQDLNSIAIENEGFIYKHVGSSDAKQMEGLESKLKANITRANELYKDYEKGVVLSKKRELLAETSAARDAYRPIIEEVLVISRQGTNNDKAYLLARTKLEPAIAKYIASLNKLLQWDNNDTTESIKEIQKSSAAAKYGTVLGSLLTLLMGVGIAATIIIAVKKALSHLAKLLTEGANQVASAASQVAASSQSLAEGASEQAASLEETSSSLEEMSSMTKQNAENALKTKTLANQTRQAADTGAADMKTMSQAMEAIKVSSSDIAKIIKTIDEIAFQTNILALNAAVEAARAGEAGMGFAVVADEVRNLAQRSAQAAKETADKIEGAIVKTEQGVQISTKVALGLEEIVGKVRQVDELIGEVAAASQEQSQGVEQVNTAITQMDKVTQSNAANSEESASAAVELNSQAANMKAAVNELLALVGGGSGRKTVERKIEKTNQDLSKRVPEENSPLVPVLGAPSLKRETPEMKRATLHMKSSRTAEAPLDEDFKNF